MRGFGHGIDAVMDCPCFRCATNGDSDGYGYCIKHWGAPGTIQHTPVQLKKKDAIIKKIFSMMRARRVYFDATFGVRLAYGYVIEDDGHIVKRGADVLHEVKDSTHAEFLALVKALLQAKHIDFRDFSLIGDNSSILDQASGKLGPPRRSWLRGSCIEAKKLLVELNADVFWVPRSRNHMAHRLANGRDDFELRNKQYVNNSKRKPSRQPQFMPGLGGRDLY